MSEEHDRKDASIDCAYAQPPILGEPDQWGVVSEEAAFLAWVAAGGGRVPWNADDPDFDPTQLPTLYSLFREAIAAWSQHSTRSGDPLVVSEQVRVANIQSAILREFRKDPSLANAKTESVVNAMKMNRQDVLRALETLETMGLYHGKKWARRK